MTCFFGRNIVSQASWRLMATALFPQALIVTIGGPSAWSLLAGVASGTVMGVPLGSFCHLTVWLYVHNLSPPTARFMAVYLPI